MARDPEKARARWSKAQAARRAALRVMGVRPMTVLAHEHDREEIAELAARRLRERGIGEGSDDEEGGGR